MSKHDKTLSPPHSANDRDITPQAATRHDGWSLPVQGAFLQALSATHSVSAAAKLEAGEPVATGAAQPDDPGEIEAMHAALAAQGSRSGVFSPAPHCPSGWSDEELMHALQGGREEGQK